MTTPLTAREWFCSNVMGMYLTAGKMGYEDEQIRKKLSEIGKKSLISEEDCNDMIDQILKIADEQTIEELKRRGLIE